MAVLVWLRGLDGDGSPGGRLGWRGRRGWCGVSVIVVVVVVVGGVRVIVGVVVSVIVLGAVLVVVVMLVPMSVIVRMRVVMPVVMRVAVTVAVIVGMVMCMVVRLSMPVSVIMPMPMPMVMRMIMVVLVVVLVARRACLRRQIGEFLVQDIIGQLQRDLVQNRQRPHGHAGLHGEVLDQGGRHAFAEQGHAFVDEAAKDPARVEAARVVHHDRGLADLKHEVEGLRDRLV